MKIWNELVAWVEKAGGRVHGSLELRTISSDHRGVFAKETITKGDVLIRLPSSLAIDGAQLPSSYESRQASAWLRCIAAFLRHDQNSVYSKSLPHQYETLWQWEEDEIQTYLAGTCPIGSDSWKMDDAEVKERFDTQIRPYLRHCGIAIDENTAVPQFARACQTLNTRGFHMGGDEPSEPSYAGPFLLPVIDLLNHSIQDACTTLQRHDNGFVMVAERDINPNHEVTHSYGSDLTSAQFLSTFGFVPLESIRNPKPAPIVLSKQTVFQCCWQVIESRLPQQIASSMNDMEDEAWTVTVDRTRNASHVPDDIVVFVDGTLLNDELVTACCVPFIPQCAYAEISRTTLLDRSILDDYFLGKLVGSAMLKVLQHKLEAYQPIPDAVRKSLALDPNSDDSKLLEELQAVHNNDLTVQKRRLLYGLAVRQEEKQTLDLLLGEIMEMLNRADNQLEMGKRGPRI